MAPSEEHWFTKIRANPRFSGPEAAHHHVNVDRLFAVQSEGCDRGTQSTIALGKISELRQSCGRHPTLTYSLQGAVQMPTGSRSLQLARLDIVFSVSQVHSHAVDKSQVGRAGEVVVGKTGHHLRVDARSFEELMQLRAEHGWLVLS